jgi:hypothetical protein
VCGIWTLIGMLIGVLIGVSELLLLVVRVALGMLMGMRRSSSADEVMWKRGRERGTIQRVVVFISRVSRALLWQEMLLRGLLLLEMLTWSWSSWSAVVRVSRISWRTGLI